MASGVVSEQYRVDTGHEDMIVSVKISPVSTQYEYSKLLRIVVHKIVIPTQHDAQMDYYGKRLATCSSDRTIKIFEVVENTQNLVATLTGWASTQYSTLSHCPLPLPLCLFLNFFVSDLIPLVSWQSWGPGLAGGLGSPQVWQHPGLLFLWQEG